MNNIKIVIFLILIRMDIIDDFLKNVKTDPNHNKKEPNYFKLIDDQNGYDEQTYIQNINDNEFILQEGQVDSCQSGLYSKPEYEGLSKSESIKKVVRDRFPRIAQEFGYVIKKLEAFKYKGKFIMKVYFMKK